MGRNDSGFVGDCQSIEISSAARRVGQSDWLPMMRPTSGEETVIASCLFGARRPEAEKRRIIRAGPCRKGATGRAALRGSG